MMRTGDRALPGKKISAFALYLRTGFRMRSGPGDAIEVKFNPWHDPDDGRFTFKNSGRYSAGSGSFGGGRPVSAGQYPVLKTTKSKPSRPTPFKPGGGSGGGGGATGGGWSDNPHRKQTLTPTPAFQGGGGSGGGAGASGNWNGPIAKGSAPSAASTQPAKPAQIVHHRPTGSRAPQQPPQRLRHVSKNGYNYEIDSAGRTQRVSGTITLNPDQKRSSSVQIQAGGADRRPSDHGGHYIARQFNGPTEAFNHFAQDGEFNKSLYARLENAWKKATKLGQRVFVDIRPIYDGNSQRPSTIIVRYRIGTNLREREFPNQHGGK